MTSQTHLLAHEESIMRFQTDLINWFRSNQRELPWREDRSPYQVWLAEIILQQTRVEQGKNYYLRFLKAFPTLKHLAEAEEKEVLNLWQGLGYYSRARNLHHSARFIQEELKGQFPDNYNDLIKLKGIGDYTASAISSIAFNQKEAVLDGNVFRVMARVFGIELDIARPSSRKPFRSLAQSILPDKNPGAFNEALMDFGATLCKPQPLCERCPASSYCSAFQTNRVKDLPVKVKKTRVKKRYLHYFVQKNGPFYLKKRGAGDIWQGLYDLPLIETKGRDLSDEDLAQFNLKESDLQLIGEYKHILSHQHLQARFYVLENLPKNVSWELVYRGDLAHYPVSRLTERFFEDYC